ncbi:hypothetical protein QJS10_CPA16g00552 [Acorus calamus]|uniref:Uncharacterized protein n=1 Tax=Acorus calamus TaxID=4465 RepID=A0AAV9D2N6_ACOCL|nr:hypothetical protein QJS10_CPA16g00552 [Acorus calamus]
MPHIPAYAGLVRIDPHISLHGSIDLLNHICGRICDRTGRISEQQERFLLTSMATSSETFEKECAEFEAKVKRTVFVDNLSPQVTKKARSVIEDMRNLPFMICGLPGPIRVQKAKAEMFGDRPRVPDRKIPFQWIGPNDTDFEVAQEMKRLVKRQTTEASLLKAFS